ncbi:putative mitochondrial DNA repair and recombination helicase protein PIF1, putative (TbPIF8) [Leptomonas pyrrhocoris]|uniref:Putative mitochondrial DNA repair and recombination helicase protein PIF1, putative (TbPIF8) n=1 Tax=Leptomonas pyrrhocoris TaxID=157538 RepID=A0A0N0E0T8_LEPPY|nr:putative mitochondrial DNA repair and recombination helicase protein PIF1, putative (TbPIF8) [Leptomonas pyrrhocoris]KPA86835.1 putative mitochondrial DNA repair and recombination helicase protein PIF1, putative (TbPIF8) [Leptomonas pyrrhocoris]|eukprot:XP_015665274.1 putative mitochondrial DNA repair and recombination helicase protein PIF1, putative (TbPIF8) [Leptomonas pyrrhocoris]
MFRRSYARLFSHLVREVDTAGFAGDFRRLGHVNAASTRKTAKEAVQAGCNVLFCGHHRTGKLTLLKAIGQLCEKEGKRVAYVSADNQRANRLDGLLIHFFIGLRVSRDELPSQEQLEGTLERHVRLVESTYASSLPSLCSVDVLVLDALERVSPSILLSMDAVARRLRNAPNAPFGGLRVYATADFWRLPVTPTSDTGGYLYQLEQWNDFFPVQKLLHTTHGQDKDLQRFTELALFGALTLEDMKEMEAKSMAGKPEAELMSWTSSTTQVDDNRSSSSGGHSAENDGESAEVDAMSVAQLTSFGNDLELDGADDEEGEEGALGAGEHTYTRRKTAKRRRGIGLADAPGGTTSRGSGTSSSSTLSLLNDDILSSGAVVTRMLPRFPRQPAIKVPPKRSIQFKRTEVGSFLVTMLAQSSTPASYGLVDALSVDVGDKVHLLMDGQKDYGVAGGAVGEVMQVRPHYLSIHFPREHRTIDLPRTRISCYHPQYPEVRYELQQFPVFPRQRICPLNILAFPNTYHVNLNGRRMADTNDLGNLLAHMRDFNDFTLRNTSDFAHLDGMVHEPTRIYYRQISGKPVTTAKEQWCRNCKVFVPAASFFQHWTACVRAVRWCGECNKTVPLALLGPHQEKHQVVLCLDCGRGVEWRHWEAHRLSCGDMMREVSADNQFIPLRTRQRALELGLDKRDLHSMRRLSRCHLPKPRSAFN